MFIEEIYRTIDRAFQKLFPKSIFVDKYFFRYFHDLAQSHLIFKNRYVRKFISLR